MIRETINDTGKIGTHGIKPFNASFASLKNHLPKCKSLHAHGFFRIFTQLKWRIYMFFTTHKKLILSLSRESNPDDLFVHFDQSCVKSC